MEYQITNDMIFFLKSCFRPYIAPKWQSINEEDDDVEPVD